jgi:Zn finger protein HypA/HybF involved in hydrogenase expression
VAESSVELPFCQCERVMQPEHTLTNHIAAIQCPQCDDRAYIIDAQRMISNVIVGK